MKNGGRVPWSVVAIGKNIQDLLVRGGSEYHLKAVLNAL